MRLIQKPNDQSGGIGDLPVTFVYSSSTCFGGADEREQIELVVSEQQLVAAMERRADVEGGRRRGVREHPVARLLMRKGIGLYIRSLSAPLASCTESTSRCPRLSRRVKDSPPPNSFSVGRQRPHRRHAARVIRGTADVRERQGR